MISKDSIEQLKQRVSISDVIGKFIKLKKSGADFTALCPFHNEKSPSFTVHPAKQIYKCFGCGKGGDAINFVMDYERRGYIEAVKYLANEYNFILEDEVKTKNYNLPPAVHKICSPQTLAYFAEHRKISTFTLMRFKVTDGTEWMPKAKSEVPVICFNYIRDDKIVNIKYRGKDHDFKMVKGAELIFYNLDSIKDSDECIICEGEVDAMSLYEAGFHDVVSVPNGGSVNGEGLAYLDNCWDYFENKTKVILVTDGDNVGYALRDELARRLGKHRCFKVNYPIGDVVFDKKKGVNRPCKDSNEVLIHFGANGLREMVNSYYEFPIDGVLGGDDLYDEIKYYWENGFPKGVQIGIPNFDDLITFQGGLFTMVTGIPGSGKSEFIDLIIARSAINHGWKWGVLSYENQPTAIHATKIMQKMAGRSFAFRKNISDRMNDNEFEASFNKVNECITFFNVDKLETSLDYLLDKAYEMVQRQGKNAFVFDPWNYIELNRPAGYTETEWISAALTKIHLFCVKTNTHVLLVAHPTKLKKEANGKYEVPTMYSISGSAHFFNKTDNGISVYRDYETGLITVYIQKIRFEWNGRVGFCQFTYNDQTRQYTPIYQV